MSEDKDISAEKAVSKFIDQMNLTAKNIGAENTHFSNPDGYYDEDNYTTAEDMMKIAIYAMEHDEIVSSAASPHVSGKLASGQSYEWLNTNKMIIPEGNLYYEYATGLKAGMTDVSGFCIAASANRWGHEIYCVVMNSESSDDRYLDTKNLFDITFSYLEEQGAADAAEETTTSAEVLEG